MSTIKTALKTPPEIQDPQELYLEWEKVRQEAIKIIEKIPAEKFRQRLSDKSWSASELTEHLYLSQFQLARLIKAVLAGKLGQNSDSFPKLDYQRIQIAQAKPKGAKNPKSVGPSGNWEKGDALSSLNKAMNRLKKNMHKKTAAELRYRGFDHPFFGPMNLLDWIWTMILHEKGHLVALSQKQ